MRFDTQLRLESVARIGLIAVALLLASSAPARAAICNWQAGANSTWNVAGNWDCGRVPLSTDSASFSSAKSNKNCSIDVDVTVVDFTMHSSYSGTISPSASPRTLRTTGDFSQSASSSTFTAPSNLIVQGTFERNFGTFNANAGSVLLTSTGTPSHAFSSVSFNNLTINDGLIAHWRLDESADGGAGGAVDSSGWGHHMTYQNTPTHTSTTAATLFRNPYAMSVAKVSPTGFGEYATLTSYPTTLKPTSWTISTWIKANAATDDSGSDVISIGDDFGVRVLPTGNVRVFSRTTGGHKHCESTDKNVLGGWHHVAGTYSGSAFTLYVDGAVPTQTDTAASSSCSGFAAQTWSGTIARLGAHPTNDDYDFDGTIDDVRIYNRVLSAVEIAHLALGGQVAIGVGVHTASTALDVDGNFTLASGTLTSANTINVGGSWLNHGGIYTGTGTVTLDGSGSPLELLSNAQPFSALTISGSGTWTIGDRLWVKGVLNQSTANVATSNYTIHTGSLSKTSGTLTAGSGTIVVDSRSAQDLRSDTALNHLRIESAAETSLIGYWKFDEGVGTITRDWSASGNNGTLGTGTRWVNSNTALAVAPVNFDNPGAAQFDLTGTDVTGTLPYSAAVTVAAWIKMTADGEGNNPRIVSTPFFSLLVNHTADTIRFETPWSASPSSPPSWQAAGSTISLNTWYHVAVTYDGSSHLNTPIIYLNGAPLATPTPATGAAPGMAETRISTPTTNNLAIGERYTDGARDFVGSIDDVRIYSTVLTAAQIAALYAGNYSGVGGGATFSLTGNTTVNGALKIDNGTLATSASSFATAATDPTQVAQVTNGTLSIGTHASGASFAGGLNVTGKGTLTMNAAGATVKVANGKVLTIDGTLDASTAGLSRTIECTATSSCNYTFTVGSSATATPVLNIDGLSIKQTDTNGLNINNVSGSSTTFTKFDNIAFSQGTGNYQLQIAASTLTLYANGLSFETTGVTTNARLVDRNATGNDVRLFVGGTCTPTTDCESMDLDDDLKLVDGTTNGSDGTPDDTGADGAVIQWLYRSYTDTGGTAVGFPTPAFDWDSFTYRTTYVAFNNQASSTGRLYARNGDGTVRYSWAPSAGENFVGSPRFTQETVAMVTRYYVYIATSNGKIYKIEDTGAALNTVAGWPFSDTTGMTPAPTVTSPLTADASNLYWSGNNGAGSPKLFSLTQAKSLNGSATVDSNLAIVPQATTITGTTFLFGGLANGKLYKISTADFTTMTTSTLLSSTALTGRMSIWLGILYFIENNGTAWAVNTADLTKNWSYQDTNAGNHPGGCTAVNQCSAQNMFLQVATQRITYGDKDGHLYVVSKNGTGGTLLNGYPWRPGADTDVFTTAPLYTNGVIAIGTSGGKVFLVDQQNLSNAPALLRTYNFRSAISTISYDRNLDVSTGEYVITTADGRLFYVSRITDPSPMND